MNVLELPSWEELERQYLESLKSEREKRLVCSCKNEQFFVVTERVAKQHRTRRAHHVRVVGKCCECNKKMRITFGGFK